ncbi:MAG: folate-binding protein [Hyphomicrobiaceae bacterium]|nr:folate-binding protein [Hyphomicrobiaceae bacterium]
MAQLETTFLADRGVVRVAGADGLKFLQVLVTNDIDGLSAGAARHAALLSPQGKILFDFFVVDAGGGVLLLDVARAQAGALAQRLSLYKLRAAIEIADVSRDYTVAALWGGACAPEVVAAPGPAMVAAPDPRLPELGWRALLTLASDSRLSAEGASPATHEDYDRRRIGLGVPEGGKDFAFGDAFPHEALFDQLHGVSFTKGCYVGQEVVARMQHRGTPRKRIVKVEAKSALPAAGTPVVAGAATIGTLGSVADREGLALIRIDRLAEATGKGVVVMAAGVEVVASVPPFATFRIEPMAGEA